MHILNITFSVDPTIQEDFIAYVTTQIIPSLDHKSYLLRIHSDANTHPTLGLQIEFDSCHTLKDFKNNRLEKPMSNSKPLSPTNGCVLIPNLKN